MRTTSPNVDTLFMEMISSIAFGKQSTNLPSPQLWTQTLALNSARRIYGFYDMEDVPLYLMRYWLAFLMLLVGTEYVYTLVTIIWVILPIWMICVTLYSGGYLWNYVKK